MTVCKRKYEKSKVKIGWYLSPIVRLLVVLNRALQHLKETGSSLWTFFDAFFSVQVARNEKLLISRRVIKIISDESYYVLDFRSVS